MENTEIIQKARAKAEMWLNDAYDKATRTEVERLLNASDPTELIDSFYNDLEFGTGGLRGIMGVGSNRMNIYTVGAATQGFANYINRLFPGENNSVCIGHDCRHHSREYAETTAAIFSANGITAYLFESLRPTPEMSFAIRELGCKGGVIITASHNPKEYNGYKAYWNDGSQLVPPHDKNVIDEVKKVKVTDIKFTAVPDKIKTLGEDFDQKFLNTVKTLSLSPEAIQHQHDLKIVFTPLHGTTYKLVPASLRNWGFTNITTIPEQMITDGDFPTVASANPEEPAAFKMALDKAREIDADLAMACDPDGDRIGIAVKDDRGEWILLNGNQTNIIFTWYIIQRRKALGLLKGNEYTGKTIVTSELIKDIAEKNGIPCYDVYRIGIAVKDDRGEWILLNGNQTNIIFTWYIIQRRKALGLLKGNEYTGKTIVTSELIKDIAEKNGIPCYDVYTGFKWIADMIRKKGAEGYIGAGEESFGFMPGSFTRDKDAVSSTSLMAEIAAWAKDQGKTLFGILESIYAEYGFSQEKMVYIVRKGLTGAQEIKDMMNNLRHNTPKTINNSEIIIKKDYATLQEINLKTGETKTMDFPTTSDVLQFFLADGCKISVRPSGTEPKIKFYFEARATMKNVNDFHKAQAEALAKIDAMMADLKIN